MASAQSLLKSARKAAGITQAELARRAGTTQSVIARLERAGANPRLDTLEKVIGAAGSRLELGLAPGNGIDESMIAADLSASPDERLRRFEELYSFAGSFGGIALPADGP